MTSSGAEVTVVDLDLDGEKYPGRLGRRTHRPLTRAEAEALATAIEGAGF